MFNVVLQKLKVMKWRKRKENFKFQILSVKFDENEEMNRNCWNYWNISKILFSSYKTWYKCYQFFKIYFASLIILSPNLLIKVNYYLYPIIQISNIFKLILKKLPYNKFHFKFINCLIVSTIEEKFFSLFYKR